MQIQVESNSNCGACEQFVFNELDARKLIRGLRVAERGQETDCDVVGVEPGGKFVCAFAVKIADSGCGFAYLISGGEWGIRIRPSAYAQEAWNLENKHQWGEPFKVYGSEEDIVYLGAKKNADD